MPTSVSAMYTTNNVSVLRVLSGACSAHVVFRTCVLRAAHARASEGHLSGVRAEELGVRSVVADGPVEDFAVACHGILVRPFYFLCEDPSLQLHAVARFLPGSSSTDPTSHSHALSDS